MASEFFAPLAQERRPSGILSGDGQADLTRSDAGRESRVPLRWFVVAAVVFGLICRLSQYAANTSVRHDEAFVALNVLQKSYAGLLGPLDWGEVSRRPDFSSSRSSWPPG